MDLEAVIDKSGEILQPKKESRCRAFTLGCRAISPNIIKLPNSPFHWRGDPKYPNIIPSNESVLRFIMIRPVLCSHSSMCRISWVLKTSEQKIGRTFSKTRWALKFPGCFLTGSAFLDRDPSWINWGYYEHIPHIWRQLSAITIIEMCFPERAA